MATVSSSSSPAMFKVKMLCRSGGRFVPSPSGGAPKYIDGEVHLISIRNDASFHDLVHKLLEVYGNVEPLVLKYQIPFHGLDALVSVSCTEDLENMIEEYGYMLAKASPLKSPKLRVFLFSTSDLDMYSALELPLVSSDDDERWDSYVDAINGVAGQKRMVGRSGAARGMPAGSLLESSSWSLDEAWNTYLNAVNGDRCSRQSSPKKRRHGNMWELF